RSRRSIGRVFTCTPQASAIEQIQLVHTLRMIDRKACRDPPAERIAHERHTPIAKRVEKSLQVEDMCANIHSFRSQRRFAKTRQIKSKHHIFFAQSWQ